MEHVRIYNRDDIAALTRVRAGECKVGERVQVCDAQKGFFAGDARFVIVGIPEDIGVRANLGRPGASTAFRPALESILNEQDNIFLDGRMLLVLGEVETADLMKSAESCNPRSSGGLTKLRELVSELDLRVTGVIREIVAAGKIPIVIGGGHNNAYGNLRACAEAFGHAVNAINCDPHLDFRPLEGRHSGNAFSYAFEEAHLKKYAVVGMHEQYNNGFAIGQFTEHAQSLHFNTYESIFVRGEKSFTDAIEQCINFLGNGPCGVEIDLDAITNVPSSARTSSGISPVQARQFVHICAGRLHAAYLHVAEGAPVLAHKKADNKTGKLIGYLVSDFIKAHRFRAERA